MIVIPAQTLARDNVDYWYIKNFDSEITVNKDSSLDIVEKITADTGSAYQHGIFRVLPTKQYADKQILSPVTLKSITDFKGNKQPYTTIKSYSDGTITWKIGDADKLVTGENYYKIAYHVKNAVRHQDGFDELYWNLNGNFWDIQIDNFNGRIIFPEEINKNNLKISTYSGSFGEENPLDIKPQFAGNNIVEVKYDKTLKEGEGITISAAFPDNIISPYVPGFWEKYGSRFYFFIIPLVFFLCLMLWRKYGRDPKINPTVAPEFEIPEKLSPIEMGLVYSDGTLKNHYISASIINLAIGGHLKIKQIGEKGIFKSVDYELEKKGSGKISSPAERQLFASLFSTGEKIKLSDLKNNFYTNLPRIKEQGSDFLVKQDFLIPYSKMLMIIFFVLGFMGLFLSFISFAFNSNLGFAILLSAIIILVFAPLMRKRSEKGHILLRRILGFKLYMDKAEKYRQRYLEDQNLFEKLLPYAIMFGITSGWIKKMQNIYGEEYFRSYHPMWFYGYGLASFNADQFSSYISQVSSNMASTTSSAPSSSGIGGGGFSGGGGGGGGGGGW